MVPQTRFVTAIILTINLGFYLASVIFSQRAGNSMAFLALDTRTLYELGAKYSPAIFAGEWWRLVTAGFLHGGLIHILMNSWVLYDLGGLVEEVYGTARYLIIYFVATIGGFLASTFWTPALSVGASAGLFGLIGAMIALTVRYRTTTGAALRNFYVRWAIYGLALGLLPGLRIDNAAHLGGLVCGFLTGLAVGIPSLFASRREKLMNAVATICVAIAGLCFVQMYLGLIS